MTDPNHTTDRTEITDEELAELPPEDVNVAAAGEPVDHLAHVGEPVEDDLGIQDALAEDEPAEAAEAAPEPEATA